METRDTSHWQRISVRRCLEYVYFLQAVPVLQDTFSRPHRAFRNLVHNFSRFHLDHQLRFGFQMCESTCSADLPARMK